MISMHQPNLCIHKYIGLVQIVFQENFTQCDNCGVAQRTDHVIIYIVIHIRERQTKNEKEWKKQRHNTRTHECS